MLKFGTSAFLKLVSLNERPQWRTIRGRVQSSIGGGYDFHRRLRLYVQRLLVGDESLESLETSIRQVRPEPEQNSIRTGMERLDAWRRMHDGDVSDITSVTYESPSGLFSVVFTPDFGIRENRQNTAVHVWNTKEPELHEHIAGLTLSLFKPLYEGAESPDDLAVLSLCDSQFHQLSAIGARADAGEMLALSMENVIRDVRDELGLPDPDEHAPEPRA